MKPILVFQTDFTYKESAVCAMYGVVKSVDRELEIIDAHPRDPAVRHLERLIPPVPTHELLAGRHHLCLGGRSRRGHAAQGLRGQRQPMATTSSPPITAR